jgi:1-acyl-sn-glycerol-3-phosphate acyltransferase
MSSIRLFSLLFCLSVLIIITIPIQTLLNIFRFKLKYIYPLFFYKVITNITGLNIHTEGFNEEDKKGTGTLYIANHVSWFDILCLGSVLNARFIAKKEVSSMGIFGFLAKLSNTFFIDNSNKNKIYQYNNFIREKLISGESLILFPEGTTSDGNGIRKFKSSLFECLNSTESSINVQSISICYSRKNNLPMGIYYRRFIAWIGETSMVDSMKKYLASGPITVNLIFHSKICMNQFNNRKELSSFCEKQILSGLNKTIKI